MARDDERSLTDLQEDAERSRAELTETVDQLRSKVSGTVTDFRKRVSPDAMKAEIGGYIRTKADALMDKARDNPLQAAAIGLGVAYPLFRIVRSIPAPILIVGTGLFLLGSSSGQKFSGNVSRRLGAAADGVSASLGASVEAASKKIHDAQDMASYSVAATRDTIASGFGSVTQQADAAGASFDQLKDGAANLVSSASDGMADLRQRTVDAIGATSDAVRGGAARTGSMFRNTAGSAAEFGTDTALRLRERAVETSQKASSGIGEVIQQNPLLVGGLGLAVGMLIASALPSSDIERNIMGGASTDVQKRANELASREFDAVSGLASGAISDLAEHAGQEGLMPADLNAAAENLGRRVRKVAESATDAAFGVANDKIIDAA
jgi:ElaB/YqjD/DUF883 family membrane-anchored ribosome-binding protein